MQQGRFDAIATGFDFGKSAKGTDYVQVQFELKTGEDAGKEITWWGYLSDGAAPITFAALKACGWNGKNFDENLEGLGRFKVSLVLANEEYEGKTKTRVKWVNPAHKKSGSLAPKTKLESRDIEAVGIRFRDVIGLVEDVDGEEVEGFKGLGSQITADDLPF